MSIPRTALSVFAAAVLATLSLALPVSSSAAPAPAFQVLQVSRPTNLVPGSDASGTDGYPEYSAHIVNVGGSSASGVVITDILPVGLTVAEGKNPTLSQNTGEKEETVSCSVSGQTVTCTALAALRSDDFVNIGIPLKVSSTAAASLTNEMRVEGRAPNK